MDKLSAADQEYVRQLQQAENPFETDSSVTEEAVERARDRSWAEHHGRRVRAPEGSLGAEARQRAES